MTDIATNGVAPETTTPGTRSLSIDRRKAINLNLCAFLDKELGKQVSLSLGASVNITQLALMTASLKTGLRANLGAGLGIGGGISGGGVGGTAGGGVNLPPGAGDSAGIAGGLSGKLGGVPTGSFSLGAGLGTRATTSGAGGASVALGVSSSGSFGVGAKAGLGGSSATGGGVKMSSGASIKASVFAALDSAMAGQGLSGSERAQLKADLTPQINSAVDDSFHSAFGPDLGYPHANGVQLLGFKVVMQHGGAWCAECEVDHPSNDSPIATGPFKFNIDGVEFVGTVKPDRSGAWGGRQRLYVVGGAGGLDNEIDAKNYGSGVTKASTVIGDILRDSGESLSQESDSALLGVTITAWHRSQGTARHAMDAVCEKIGATWRVLRDGTVWVGTDEWPEVEPAGTVMDQDWSKGHVQVAPDNATLVPGIIVRGQQIQQVVYRSGDDGKLRAELHAKSTRQLADGILDRAQRKNQYGYQYRCRVSRRNADGTVDVVTDDDRMRGTGVARCRVLAGLMNTQLKPEAGAMCLVGWSGADPSLPYVHEFEAGSPGVTAVGTGGRGAAFTGGTVTVLLPALMPFQGTVAGAPAAGVLTIVDPGIAVIGDGSADLTL